VRDKYGYSSSAMTAASAERKKSGIIDKWILHRAAALAISHVSIKVLFRLYRGTCIFMSAIEMCLLIEKTCNLIYELGGFLF